MMNNIESFVLEKLKQFELSLLSPAAESDFLSFEQLLSDHFVEFGSSGKTYNKNDTLEILRKRKESRVATDLSPYNFNVVTLAEDVYLLTYFLRQEADMSLRSSIWKKSGEQWQILFHQGTIVKE